jgi:hypothetical protein
VYDSCLGRAVVVGVMGIFQQSWPPEEDETYGNLADARRDPERPFYHAQRIIRVVVDNCDDLAGNSFALEAVPNREYAEAQQPKPAGYQHAGYLVPIK